MNTKVAGYEYEKRDTYVKQRHERREDGAFDSIIV